jgi:hypothetical protein
VNERRPEICQDDAVVEKRDAEPVWVVVAAAENAEPEPVVAAAAENAEPEPVVAAAAENAEPVAGDSGSIKGLAEASDAWSRSAGSVV